jgi:hypothetical protein
MQPLFLFLANNSHSFIGKEECVMELKTRQKIGNALCLGYGVALGSFVSVVTAAACKSIAGNNPLAMVGLYAVSSIGGAKLASLASEPIARDIHAWVYKEENEKLIADLYPEPSET